MSDIIKDDGFQIQTKPARNALTSAEKMLEWIDSNKDEAKAIASHLIGNIQRCFSKKSKNPRTARDTLWKNSFQLCSSDASAFLLGVFLMPLSAASKISSETNQVGRISQQTCSPLP